MTVLFFNLRLLEEQTCCDPVYIVTALDKLYKGQVFPRNSREKYKPIPNLKAGTSFLLNPAPFFKNKNYDPGFRAQYIRLAGRRDWLNYKLYGDSSLDLTLFPDIDYSVICFNPLLAIANNRLHFKYER